jgi:murein DD-endopeptidase MepM/ murein hydrolase activator NlpD
MKKRFAFMTVLGAGAALSFAGFMSLSTTQAASDAPLLTEYAETGSPAPIQLAYYMEDSTAESAQLSVIYERKLTVGNGDTLMAMLTDAGAARRDAHAAITEMSKIFKPRYLKPGHEIILTLRPSPDPDSPANLVSMKLIESVERDVLVREAEEGYVAETVEHPLTLEVAAAESVIENSLFLAGESAGVPPGVLADLIQIYSFDVDFQRDIRTGDGFTVLYEQYMDENGELVRSGNIMRASMTLSGQEKILYRFETAKGTIDYFDPEGKSVRRTLMRTPINGARLSSNYGNRKHPILGYTKLHTGTDFAAPRGTPIYAAGNGSIVHAGRNQTAYAHMSGIARGVRKGKRVNQGQVIGYVGTTGRSTGNHLHYEVIRNGKFINSRRMHLPSGKALKGDDLAAFRAMTEEANARYGALMGDTVLFASKDAGVASNCESAEAPC